MDAYVKYVVNMGIWIDMPKNGLFVICYWFVRIYVDYITAVILVLSNSWSFSLSGVHSNRRTDTDVLTTGTSVDLSTGVLS
jgi:hypothetical protein